MNELTLLRNGFFQKFADLSISQAFEAIYPIESSLLLTYFTFLILPIFFRQRSAQAKNVVISRHLCIITYC